MAIKDELLELLRRDSDVRQTARDENVTEEFRSVPGRLDQLTKTVRALAAAQLRTEQRIEALAEAQERTEGRVEVLAEAQRRTEERVEALAAAQLRTEERLDTLIAVVEGIARDVAGLLEWQRGEQGRREGERYERDTVRNASLIIGGG
jgi:hypothetical protein